MGKRRESHEERESRPGSVSALTCWFMSVPASNPGLLPFSPFRYWRCFPLFATLHLVGPVLLIVLAFLMHWVFAIAAFV